MDGQKVYPPLDGQQAYAMQSHQQGYPPQQNYHPQPMAPPSYDGQPNIMQPVITHQPTTTVIVQQARFGPDPTMMVCPQCRATITTSVKYEPALKTHLIAGFICLIGCWAGCCIIPYCVDSCQNANHSCPNCGTYLGAHD